MDLGGSNAVSYVIIRQKLASVTQFEFYHFRQVCRNLKKTCFSVSKADFPKGFCANYSRNLKNKNLKNVFSNIGPKMSMGRPPTKIYFLPEFFYPKFDKNIFVVGDLKIRRFLAFFHKSMSEISVSSWEKTCFLCCRFFRKIEEIGVILGGGGRGGWCAMNFFSQKLINVVVFRYEKKRDQRQTRRFVFKSILWVCFFLTQYAWDNQKNVMTRFCISIQNWIK